MKEKYKYGAVYWRYGTKNWEDAETLEELVSYIGYRSDDGELAYDEDEFYAHTDEGWVSVDVELVKDLFDKRDQREQERYDTQRNQKVVKPWQIRIRYPQNTEELWNRFETKEEAEKEQASLDPRLDSFIIEYGEKDLW